MIEAKFKNFFPTDRFSFEDLEVILCGGGKVSFSQGYYYCPLLSKENNTIEFKKITNTFVPQDEKPEKIFQLKEKIPKHFYLKVTLDPKAIQIEYPSYEEDQDSPYSNGLEPKYYKPLSVEISDDEISKINEVGYPFFESVSKESNLPTIGYKGTLEFIGFKDVIVYESNKPGSFSKKNNIFYIYLCSLYYDNETNEVSRLLYYMSKASEDPAIVLPDPIKRTISNRHITDEEKDEIVIIRNAIGERVYKTNISEGESKNYKRKDFGDDKGNGFDDIKYNKRDERYQNIYLDSKDLRDRCIEDALILQDKNFIPNTRPADLEAYVNERLTFSPYPILGISAVKQTVAFSSESEGYGIVVIG